MDFGELLGNGRIYRVPAYQRDYTWTEEDWEDLWLDVVALPSEGTHYMGAFVIEGIRDRDREFSIIDGQQRAATLSVLALAIIRTLEDLARAGTDSQRNEARARELRRAFIGDKDPASLLESSKLFLNETDDPFYQDYLVQLREPANPRRLPKSNRLLWECFRYFVARIGELEFSNDGEALARFLNEVVARQLLFIVITVEDEINAYTVFETLNARGVDLTTTDLLKNYLFSRVNVRSDLEALQRRWAQVVSIVGAEHFPAFLRYHMQTTEPRVRSERLFKLIRDRTKTATDVFALLEALESRSELYAALGDPHHGYWVNRPDAKPHIRELVLFGTRQMTPLLFAAFETLTPQQFSRVLHAVSVLLFRYTVVGDLNTNALEPVFHRAAKALIDGSVNNVSGVTALLQPVYVDDAKFEQDFANMTMATGGQKKRLAKYVLARLEQDESRRQVDPETDPGTIEHILPENPDDAWDALFTADEQERLVMRLGNLTLLEASLNREIANASYERKVATYARSEYAITNAVAVSAPVEWTPAHIAERQRRLAQRATHIWRIDL